MFYGIIAGITFLISTLTILAQLILLPMFFKHTAITRYDVEERMKIFKVSYLLSIVIKNDKKKLLSFFSIKKINYYF